jgi:hypothetical protein
MPHDKIMPIKININHNYAIISRRQNHQSNVHIHHLNIIQAIPRFMPKIHNIDSCHTLCSESANPDLPSDISIFGGPLQKMIDSAEKYARLSLFGLFSGIFYEHGFVQQAASDS